MAEVSEADARWLAWQHDLVKTGAEAVGATPAGNPVLGLRSRTVGCRVSTPTGDRWLRVVTELEGWGWGPAWDGNWAANTIQGVGKPDVLQVAEWDEPDWHRAVRAELMTLAPGTAIATEIVLRDSVSLDDRWWVSLRASLDALAGQPTERVCLDDQLLHRRLLAAFGIDIDTTALAWTTAHGDLHWANLTAPGCWVLDWESWGTAPAGYDAALLYSASLLQPEIAGRVRGVFADVLSSGTGLVSQLAAAAKLLRLVEEGDHHDLAIPLHWHARKVVEELRARR